MNVKKYEFTGETQDPVSKPLRRIRALIDIPGVVKAGELGGWLMSENNLAHEGCCWVADEADVWGNATVTGDAIVEDAASVCGTAKITGRSRISGHLLVYGDVVIEDSQLEGTGEIRGDCVFRNVKITLNRGHLS